MRINPPAVALLGLAAACSGGDGGRQSSSHGTGMGDGPTQAAEVLDSTSADLDAGQDVRLDFGGEAEADLVPNAPLAGFGAPCESNAECDSNWCLDSWGTGLCTDNCIDECPSMYECLGYNGYYPSPVFICTPTFSGACRPCEVEADCKAPSWYLGGDGFECVALAGDRFFCLATCVEDTCADGAKCTELAALSGARARACVPASGECECLGRWEGATGRCTDPMKPDAVCPAAFACKGGEFTRCFAPEWAPDDTCNGEDEDCDGEADDDWLPAQCVKQGSTGQCSGVTSCAGGIEECVVDGYEVCNGKDDDCDGVTDGFFGTTTCGMGECKHTSANCVDGVPRKCDPLEGASEEISNMVDDDCDGLIDEGLPCHLANFDTAPDSAKITPATWQLDTYQSWGLIVVQGKTLVSDGQAHSKPNHIAGAVDGDVELKFVAMSDPTQPAQANGVSLWLVGVGDSEVSVAALGSDGQLLELRSVTNTGTLSGYGNGDHVEFTVDGVASVLVSQGELVPTDAGWGVDSVSYCLE